MHRYLRDLPIVLLVVLLASPSAAQERTWPEARGNFLKAWGAARKPEERMHAIYDHLEGQDRPELVPVLAHVLRDPDERAAVVGAAVAVLGDLRSEEAVAALVEASTKGADILRARLLQALGKCGTEAASARLIEALEERDVLVRIAAAEGLGAAGAVSAVPRLGATLRAPEWPVKSAAIEALGRIDSDGAVPHLIAALGREPGRLREDCAWALTRITNERHGVSFADWKAWWEQKGFELEYDRGSILPDPTRPTVVYHGLPTWALRVVFVFDVSQSMRAEVRVDLQNSIPQEIREEDGPELEQWEAMKTKIEWARAHLIQAIRTMHPDVEFAIVTYNEGYTPVFSGRLLRASDENKEKAITRVAALSPSGETNLYNALLGALQIPEKGVLSRQNLLEGPGTIYFMSDGVSTQGEIQDGHRIAEEILRINGWRRVRFHCIGIGNEYDAALMADLASRSGGGQTTLD